MTAVAVFAFSPMYALVGLAVTIAVAVLAAHWGAYRPQVKRLIAASLTASVLVATVAAPIVRAEDEFVMMNPCSQYEPWSAMWIYHLCMLPRRSRRRLARRTR